VTSIDAGRPLRPVGCTCCLVLCLGGCGGGGNPVGELSSVGNSSSGTDLILYVGPDASSQSQVFTIRLDGSNKKQLTQGPDGHSYAAWSRDGARIAFASGSDAPEIWVMNADGSGQTQLTFPPASGNQVPTWSPDGTQIAFASTRTGHPEIWVMNMDGSNPKQLTTAATAGGSNAPFWSPDGTKILFASDRSGSPQVYSMNPDGGGALQLTFPDGSDYPASNVPVFSPDGTKIAFWSGIESKYGQVWVMNADGSNRKVLSSCTPPSNCDNPAWSPDGAQIIFETDRDGPVETWVMNAHGTDQHQLLSFPYGAGRLPWQPAPSSASQIVFMTPTNGGVFPPGTNNIPWEIVVMNLDGSGRRQLTTDGKFKFLPHFSPDGSKIVYAEYAVGGYGNPNAQPDAFVYDLTSGQETQLTHTGSTVQPVCAPDGQRMAYVSYQNGSLWVMNADGSNPKLLIQPSGAPDDVIYGDLAWSWDDWILFSVVQNTNSCFKVRLDKIRPGGTARTQVTDGGPNCTPAGAEQSGDADPGFSADSRTIFSSRGFPVAPAGATSATERKLYAFSSDAWFPAKPETDLSLPSEPSCIEGVPKGSPDGKHVLLYRICFDTGSPVGGIYLTDTSGSYRTFITHGFGADWNPAWKP